MRSNKLAKMKLKKNSVLVRLTDVESKKLKDLAEQKEKTLSGVVCYLIDKEYDRIYNK